MSDDRARLPVVVVDGRAPGAAREPFAGFVTDFLRGLEDGAGDGARVDVLVLAGAAERLARQRFRPAAELAEASPDDGAAPIEPAAAMRALRRELVRRRKDRQPCSQARVVVACDDDARQSATTARWQAAVAELASASGVHVALDVLPLDEPPAAAQWLARAREGGPADADADADGTEPPYVVAASVIGPLHVAKALPCQDAFEFTVADDVVVVAVADGLGSAALSDLGAQAAVETAAREAARRHAAGGFDGDTWADELRAVMAAARASVEAEADASGAALRELGCTLLVAVATAEHLHAAQVGDGAVVAHTDAGLRLVTRPDESEYVNEVTPLTADGYESSVQATALTEPVDAVAVLTDGCQRAGLKNSPDGPAPHPGFFEPMFRFARTVSSPAQGQADLEDFLDGAKMRDSSEDDKTLVLAVLKNQPPTDP